MAGRWSGVEFDADAVFLGTPLAEVLNRDTNAVSTAVRYRLTPLTTLLITGEASRDRFTLSPERDADSLLLLPGAELNHRALISGAHVGYRRVRPLDDRVPKISGVVRARRVYRPLGVVPAGTAGQRNSQLARQRLRLPHPVV